jgi:MYND finger
MPYESIKRKYIILHFVLNERTKMDASRLYVHVPSKAWVQLLETTGGFALARTVREPAIRYVTDRAERFELVAPSDEGRTYDHFTEWVMGDVVVHMSTGKPLAYTTDQYLVQWNDNEFDDDEPQTTVVRLGELRLREEPPQKMVVGGLPVQEVIEYMRRQMMGEDTAPLTYDLEDLKRAQSELVRRGDAKELLNFVTAKLLWRAGGPSFLAYFDRLTRRGMGLNRVMSIARAVLYSNKLRPNNIHINSQLMHAVTARWRRWQGERELGLTNKTLEEVLGVWFLVYEGTVGDERQQNKSFWLTFLQTLKYRVEHEMTPLTLASFPVVLRLKMRINGRTEICTGMRHFAFVAPQLSETDLKFATETLPNKRLGILLHQMGVAPGFGDTLPLRVEGGLLTSPVDPMFKLLIPEAAAVIDMDTPLINVSNGMWIREAPRPVAPFLHMVALGKADRVIAVYFYTKKSSPPPPQKRAEEEEEEEGAEPPPKAHRVNACVVCAAPESHKMCSGCKKVRYCGARCQNEHWARVHHAECAPKE